MIESDSKHSTATQMVPGAGGLKRRVLDASVGFTKNEERILQVKVVDESDPQLSNLGSYLHAFGEDLAESVALKDQVFTEERVKEHQQKRLEVVIQRNKRQQGQNVTTVALNQEVKKRLLREFLNEFVSEQGLTVKPEGKLIMKCASSQLSVILKIFVEKDERVLNIANEVSFLGGDKEGKKFTAFVDSLSFKLANAGLLKNQSYQASQNPYLKKTPSAVFRDLKEPEPKSPSKTGSLRGSSPPTTPSRTSLRDSPRNTIDIPSTPTPQSPTPQSPIPQSPSSQNQAKSNESSSTTPAASSPALSTNEQHSSPTPPTNQHIQNLQKSEKVGNSTESVEEHSGEEEL